MRRSWRRAAASSAVAAGLLHVLAVIGDGVHAGEIIGFFLVAGAAKIALACSLNSSDDARVLVAGLIGTVALAVLYLVSRVAHVPFAGMHNDRALHPDPLGYTALACECVTLAALLALMPVRVRSWSLAALFAVCIAASLPLLPP